MSSIDSRPANSRRPPAPAERLAAIPRCPACGKRVIDDGHGVHLHGNVYHARCVLYRRGGQ